MISSRLRSFFNGEVEMVEIAALAILFFLFSENSSTLPSSLSRRETAPRIEPDAVGF